MDSTGRRRGGAVLRWALAAVTLLAVLGMHSLVAPGVGGSHIGRGAIHMTVDAAAAMTIVAEVGTARPAEGPTQAVEETPCAARACAGQDGHEPANGAHTMAHLCIAVLVGIVAVALALAAFRAVGVLHVFARLFSAGARPRLRAPPWTHPSLTQLSVLRV